MCYLVFRRRKAGSKTKASLFVFLGGHTASRADDTASIVVFKKSTSPTVMFTRRLVLPSAMTWTVKSACVANSPQLHNYTRARFLLLAVVMVLVLYGGWFWCCYYCNTAAYSLVLFSSSLVTKRRKKKRTSQKAKKAKNFGKVLFPSN